MKPKAAAKAAIAKIQAITAELNQVRSTTVRVIRIVEFGAFVNIMPGTDGLLHISQISNERIANVTDVLKEGQEVKVQVQDVDNRGRIKLTMKDIEQA
ncbi:S1 RNA-binding domain-containing protein [Acinetobacter baumannii]